MGNYISCSSSCACLEGPLRGGGCGARAESKRKLQSCMITVVHSVEGRVIEVGGGAPMKVAEIMLEFPGHFVCQCERETHMNRATPLPADREAVPGRVYILFPMQKLHTRLSPHECSSYINLLHTHIVSSHLASRKKKKNHFKHLNASKAKVTPLNMQLSNPPPQHEHEHLPMEDCPSHEEMDSFLVQFSSSQRPNASSVCSNNSTATSTLSRSKSWIPRLETIKES